MRLAERFNRSRFSIWINRPAGRVFRLAAGTCFLVWGIRHRGRAAGIGAMIWSLLPLSAGSADLCFISGAVGGPLKGEEIRAWQTRELAAPADRSG